MEKISRWADTLKKKTKPGESNIEKYAKIKRTILTATHTCKVM